MKKLIVLMLDAANFASRWSYGDGSFFAEWGVDVQELYPDLTQQGWNFIEIPFAWVYDEIYASFWCFFRIALNVGGFASYTRIEVFNTGTVWQRGSIDDWYY